MTTLNFDTIQELAKTKGTKRVAVIAADDIEVIDICENAQKQGLIAPVFIFTDEQLYTTIKSRIDSDCLLTSSRRKAAEIGVKLWINNKVDIILKGIISTKEIIQMVLIHKNQLVPGSYLSHLALFQLNNYPKLLGLSDAAINITPGIKERVNSIKNASEAFAKIEIIQPNIALLSAIEKVNKNIISSVESLKIKEEVIRLGIDCCIEGPISFDLAISKEAASTKHFKSEISGDTDLLIVPEIVSGNILYKSLTYMAGASCASVVLGAKAPIILTSRADNKENKLFSITLGVAIS